MNKYFVYCLYKEDQIIYIGSSTKLLNRLKTHRKDKEFDKVIYCETVDKQTMLDLEIYAINKARPPLNRIFPQSKMLKIPDGIRWHKANLAFLNYDKVDIYRNVAFSAHWSYMNYVSTNLGIHGISPYDTHLTYVKINGIPAAVFDGSGKELGDFAVDNGLLSPQEYEDLAYIKSGQISIDEYERSLKQFD